MIKGTGSYCFVKLLSVITTEGLLGCASFKFSDAVVPLTLPEPENVNVSTVTGVMVKLEPEAELLASSISMVTVPCTCPAHATCISLKFTVSVPGMKVSVLLVSPCALKLVSGMLLLYVAFPA